MQAGVVVTPYQNLADAAVAQGWAVLAYDKRSTHAQCDAAALSACSLDCLRDAASTTYDDFVADAAAAVSFLTKHTDVDAANIVIAGHSQGT